MERPPLPSLETREATCSRPDGSPVMFQSWYDLLFLHWEWSADAIQETLPPGLHVDTHEGNAFIGLVPFFMQNIRPRFCPTVPGISNFLEMNVRTYVYDDNGTPGVWFYSLDANQWLAVRLARSLFRLPYFDAVMSASRSDGWIDYQCQRRPTKGATEEKHSSFRYQGISPFPEPQPGSLEYFLLERYVLFAYHPARKKLFSGKVHHPPYSARTARVEAYDAAALTQAGFEVGDRYPDHLIMSPGVDVEVFPLKAVG